MISQLKFSSHFSYAALSDTIGESNTELDLPEKATQK